MQYGSKALVLNTAEFGCYAFDLADLARRYFKDEGVVPTLKEFEEYIYALIENDFYTLEQDGINDVVYLPPYGEGNPVVISSASELLEFIKENFHLEDLYQEVFNYINEGEEPS